MEPFKNGEKGVESVSLEDVYVNGRIKGLLSKAIIVRLSLQITIL